MSFPQILCAAARTAGNIAQPAAGQLTRLVAASAAALIRRGRTQGLLAAVFFATVFFAAGLAFVMAPPLLAQLPTPRLHGIYPPGGQRGTTFEVTIQGLDLDTDLKAAQELQFSHPGITAERKMTPPRAFEKEPQPVAGQFVVTIAGDVPLGIHEARVRGRYGLSTPRSFAVGNLPEGLEQGTNNSLETPMPLELNSVVNGRSAADSFDVFQFTASAGQRVLLRCEALRLDSRMDATLMLLDASGQQLAYSRDARRSEPIIDFIAPADGNYLVQVYDFTYRGGDPFFYRLSVSTQPHIDFVFPPAGMPGVTGKFTLYGRNLPGAVSAEGVAIDGVELQKLDVEIPVPAETQDASIPLSSSFVAPPDTGKHGFEYRLESPAGPSNPVFISFATAAVVTEQEPNDDRDQPQSIAVPCNVVGQFFAEQDRDWFSFQAKKGEIFAVEVFSQRRSLPTDPFLLVQHVSTNPQGEPTVRDIAESDDIDPKFANPPFDTPVRDAALVFTADADGTYRVLLRDLYSDTNPDPRHVYRLSIGPPKPDFHLLATFKDFADPDPAKTLAAAPILRPSGSLLTIVQAYRRGGFEGPITVAASGLPEGVVCPPVVIPAGQNQATLVFAAADNAAPQTDPIEIVGTASIGDQEVRREALASVVVWDKNSANETTYARLTGDIGLSLIAEPMPLTVALGSDPVPAADATPAGSGTLDAFRTLDTSRASKLSLPVRVTRREGVKGELKLEARGLPAEIKAAPLTLNQETAEGMLEITVEPNAPIGSLSFYLSGQSTVAYQRNREAAAEAEEAKKQFAELITQLTAASQAAEAAKVAAEAKATELAAAADTPEVAEQRAMAEQAKTQTAAAAMAAAATLQAAQQAQPAVDKRAADLAAAAAAKDIPVSVQSLPVTLRIAAAPIALTATPPAAAIPAGGQGEIAVAVERQSDFAAAVDFEIGLPPNVQGIQIDKVSLAGDQTKTALVVKAAADATPGSHQVTLHAKLQHNAHALQIDQPLVVTVEAAAAAAPPAPN